MTKKEILDAIHGQMIISCQAVEGEPLYVEEKSIMHLMARAAKQAGTPAIRTSSIRDVIAIKEETGLPVIGEGRIHYPDQAVKALQTGAWAIVVGGAITRPLEIAMRFQNAIKESR